MSKGVQSIVDLKARCEIDGKHWIWTMKSMSGNAAVPQSYYKGKNIAARRLAWILSGKKIAQGHVIAGSCSYSLCVNPACCKSVSKAESVSIASKAGKFDTLRRKMASRQSASTYRRKFTTAQALQILADQRPQDEIAKDWGVRRQTIGLIKQRKTYKDLPVPGDVFGLAAGGLFTRLVCANDSRRAA